MHDNISQIFENEKLSLMVKPYTDKKTIYFPNHINNKINCNIDSPLAMGVSSILKAGFNVEELDLKKSGENDISVTFNGKEIQRLIFKEVTSYKFSQEISNYIKNDIENSKADKVTYVFFDKKTFLKQENSFASYLRALDTLKEDSTKITVEDLRIMLLAESGMYIEEYENKKLLLKGQDILNPLLISHFNTVSTQIILNVENYDEIKDKLNKAQLGSINIVASLKSGINLPIDSINPFSANANYRDLNTKEIFDNKLPSFLDTLIAQANDYNNAKKRLQTESSPEVKEELKSIMKYYLSTNGCAKELYSLRPDIKLISMGVKEIIVYSNNNNVCISSKSTCLGNGQHSTSTYKILDLLLHCDDHTDFILKEKFDCNEIALANLFQVNTKGSIAKAAQEKIFKLIKKSGLEVEEFIDFFKQSFIGVNWTIAQSNPDLKQKIATNNTITEQNKDDDWLNENKDYFSKFFEKYNKINSKEITEFSQIKKDSTHFLNKFQTTFKLKGVKTLDVSSSVSHNYTKPIKINDIYHYMSLICSSNKNNSPIDSPYTEVADFQKNQSKGSLRNVYQKDTLDKNLDKFWAAIFNMEKPGNKATFENFLSFMTGETIGKNTSKSGKYFKFIKMGNEALNNNYALSKIPAIILYRDMAQYYFNKIIDVLPQSAINIDNFTSLAFNAYIQKLGKSNNSDIGGFTLDNIKQNGELILMDISNSLHKYYSENDVLTNDFKRKGLQDNKGLLGVKHLTIEIFEPYKDARVKTLNNTDSEKLNNIQFKSIFECMSAKKPKILEYFDEYFGLDKEFKKDKKATTKIKF
ncbi:MAG: DUF4168 domain-containing protein [Candidatus Sericytochromatia bacterium]|nr:DUF4168 domain-containing protein [Candidatus Sericytochromatia bacterium]